MKSRYVAALILCLHLVGSGASALSHTQYEQIVLVIWHGATFSDLEETVPHTPQAWALLNTRTGGGAGVEGSYLSISSGARAIGVVGAGEVYNRDENHNYELNSGLQSTAIVQPTIWSVMSGQTADYTVKPGSLAASLKEQGYTIAAYGNSDTNRTARWAGTVATDFKGQVEEGNVGDGVLIFDDLQPFGVRTNYDALLDLVQNSTANLVVVDLGDPYRLEEAGAALWPDQYQLLRDEMVAEAREFLAELLQEMPEGRAVLVLSPHPGQSRASQGQWIAPVVLYGKETGLLQSPTTKWPGIVTNMDVAPTVMQLLGAKYPSYMIGSPMEIVPLSAKEALQQVQTLEESLLALNKNRGVILRALVGFQIGIYVVTLALMAFGISRVLPLVRIIQLFLVLALALPLYLLILPKGIWAVIVLTIMLLLIGLFTRNFLWATAGVGLLTALLVSLDTFTGSSLMRFSYLGYDPIGGARFYGLGNEFMGILVGSLIMGWVCLAELMGLRRRQTIAWAVPLFVLVLGAIAAPWWGTNVGGAITAVLGFGVTLGALGNFKVSWRTVLLLGFAVVLILGALMYLDAGRAPEQQSHIGQTVRTIRGEGLLAVYNIIQRKLAMNLRLIRYSIWSRAWIVALALIGASFIWPSRFIAWLAKKYPQIANGIWGTVVAGMAALIFNDSGVVAAATCVFFAASTMAVLALEYRLLKHDFLSSESHIEDNTNSH